MSLRVVKKILKKVNHYADEMASLSDNQLKDKTKQFRKRVKNGESLDSILPEAFAAMREADKRVLGMFPYDVQVMGGIVLHQGNIAEMKTGEGKTLTATMPNSFLKECTVDRGGSSISQTGMSSKPTTETSPGT